MKTIWFLGFLSSFQPVFFFLCYAYICLAVHCGRQSDVDVIEQRLYTFRAVNEKGIERKKKRACQPTKNCFIILHI